MISGVKLPGPNQACPEHSGISPPTFYRLAAITALPTARPTDRLTDRCNRQPEHIGSTGIAVFVVHVRDALVFGNSGIGGRLARALVGTEARLFVYLGAGVP